MRQEKRVNPRRGFAFDADVNASRNDEQRANQRNEADILMSDLQRALPAVEPEKVIDKGDGAERIGDFGIMPGPPIRAEQRGQRQGRQQQPKGQNHPGIRFNQLMAHSAKPSGDDGWVK